MWENVSLQLYHLQQFSDNLVHQQLTHLSLASLFLVFAAGLLTSLTPCTLSMLPITIGYIGGTDLAGDRQLGLSQALCFCLGLATTLAGLGVVAAGFGQIYGQIGIGLPILVSAIAILMGLNLLEILPLRFPSLVGDTDWIQQDVPKALRSYLVGLTFGLVASPCSTPVLATLLAWVSTTQNLALGGGLLLTYTLGYVVPILITGLFTASLKRLLSLRQWSGWINPISGALLLCFGIFSLLIRLPIGLA